jgi:hypothetical protein
VNTINDDIHEDDPAEASMQPDFQFYPTPRGLASRLWGKFKNRNFVRVLEPQAGNGDLAAANPWADEYHHHRRIPIDCCEIDVSKHDVLRAKGFNVVGIDFLAFNGGALYSHLCMNPPFADGAKHLLKAWEILWDGEICCLLNSETIRNPYSRERQLLVSLIERHGEVEFIEGAFLDAERKTQVDVALVYLRKQANVGADIIGDILGDLKQEADSARNLAAEYREVEALALPNSFVENSVLAFNAAVRAMRDSIFAEARASYYATLLGETMAIRSAATGTTENNASVVWVQRTIGERYDELKDRAWSCILRSTNVTSRLSSGAQRRVEHEFEAIKKLEFNPVNIYGFLCGLIENRGKIQIDMACECFDLITRYHSDNTVFYKGWMSNDRHRTCAMRIKTTRFVLPGHKTESYHSSLTYTTEGLLADFDKVFALLDGKAEPDYGLVQASRDHYQALKNGERVSSSYFDLRFYKCGTLHFFPRDKKIVDRLNRLVGKHRRWIPQEGTRVPDAFWLNYDSAEKFDKELRAEIGKRSRHHWDHPLFTMFSSDEHEKAKAAAAIDEALTLVLERHGINVDFQIEQPGQALLLAA